MAQVLRYIDADVTDENVLVGFGHADDASVYKLTDDIAIIQTLDFFTPIVDDPYMFGQIAAANSLSDIYAMGGTPKIALNIVGYPISELGPETLSKILQGALDKAKEAGVSIVGGHSVDDKEPKFGLSVTGVVHPESFYKNIGAKPGDALILTKPIGSGVLTTAIKRDLLDRETIDEASNIMATLNKEAARLFETFQPNAVTDVTGFGLLGHAYEMASGSGVSMTIRYGDVPLLSKTEALAKEHVFPGGSWKNHKWLEKNVVYDESLDTYQQVVLCDATTSGGLLISMPKDDAQTYVDELNKRQSIPVAVIGEVTEKKEKTIYVGK